jgi:D-lactate dehydrogenase (cytochrome)
MVPARLRTGKAAIQSWQAARLVAAVAPSTTRCYSSDDGSSKTPAKREAAAPEAKAGRSFQGQVMGSIGARLRREREQRVEYEKWRTATDPMRNWSFTFGKSQI